MTPGVSATVVVKGFQGMAAIKQRPLKRGNRGSRVSGFTVSCHVAPGRSEARASCRRHRVASIRALAAKTVLRIGDKFAGSPTCAEAPALIRDRGESVAHGDDGVGVRGAALHCVLARRYMQRGDSGKKRAKLDTRFTFRRQESLTVTESRDP